MRTLLENEVTLVNGAGAAVVKGVALGKDIGAFVDSMTNTFGIYSNFTAAFAMIGASIGAIIELNFSVGFKGLYDGIILTINAFKKPEEPAA